MIFQTISDWSKREFHKKFEIPSFGGAGFEQLKPAEAEEFVRRCNQEYIELATMYGMSKPVLQVMMGLLKISKAVPKNLLFTNGMKDWHYS